MDRDWLAARNNRLAAQRHRRSRRHQLRDFCLLGLSRLPIPRQIGDNHRVLLIRPDQIGDALLATPAIRRLKQRKPELELHALCNPAAAEALAEYEELDQVLTLPFPGFARGDGAGRNPYRLAWRSARTLRRMGYESAIVMRPDHWWGAMLAFLAGIPQRVGYAHASVAPFLTTALPLRQEHAVEQNLRLIEALTREEERSEVEYSFPVPGEARLDIERILADCGIESGAALICIHPGAGADSKLWTAEKWARTADDLARQYRAAIVITGTAGERAQAEAIAGLTRGTAHILAGETSIARLAALYERALLVLGADSGAMHLAAAVDAPAVTLFGPADPFEFAPWGERRAVATAPIGCRPCRILDWRGDREDFHPCVRDISVEQVLEAARRLIDRGC